MPNFMQIVPKITTFNPVEFTEKYPGRVGQMGARAVLPCHMASKATVAAARAVFFYVAALLISVEFCISRRKLLVVAPHEAKVEFNKMVLFLALTLRAMYSPQTAVAALPEKIAAVKAAEDARFNQEVESLKDMLATARGAIKPENKLTLTDAPNVAALESLQRAIDRTLIAIEGASLPEKAKLVADLMRQVTLFEKIAKKVS